MSKKSINNSTSVALIITSIAIFWLMIFLNHISNYDLKNGYQDSQVNSVSLFLLVIFNSVMLVVAGLIKKYFLLIIIGVVYVAISISILIKLLALPSIGYNPDIYLKMHNPGEIIVSFIFGVIMMAPMCVYIYFNTKNLSKIKYLSIYSGVMSAVIVVCAIIAYTYYSETNPLYLNIYQKKQKVLDNMPMDITLNSDVSSARDKAKIKYNSYTILDEIEDLVGGLSKKYLTINAWPDKFSSAQAFNLIDYKAINEYYATFCLYSKIANQDFYITVLTEKPELNNKGQLNSTEYWIYYDKAVTKCVDYNELFKEKPRLSSNFYHPSYIKN